MAADEPGPDSGPVFPLAPPGPGQGAGWAKLAAAVEAQVPPAEIETLYVFRPIKREGKEWGTPAAPPQAPPGRLPAYTAKYTPPARGQERRPPKTPAAQAP